MTDTIDKLRALFGPEGSDHGILPICQQKAKARHLTFYYPPGLILIVDLYGMVKDSHTSTVTNDAENVIDDIGGLFKSLDPYFLTTCTILYRDSEGLWDGIRTDDAARFHCFYSVNAKSAREAIKKAVDRHWDYGQFGASIDYIDQAWPTP